LGRTAGPWPLGWPFRLVGPREAMVGGGADDLARRQRWFLGSEAVPLVVSEQELNKLLTLSPSQFYSSIIRN
jgi:hypothetical protein